jgi:hypothetical protein
MELGPATAGELAVIAHARAMARKLASRNSADNPIDLDDMDEEEIARRVEVTEKRKEEYVQFLKSDKEQSSALGGEASSVTGESSKEGAGGALEDAKPAMEDVKRVNMEACIYEKMSQQVQRKQSNAVAIYTETISALKKSSEEKDRLMKEEKEQREREEVEKKAKRKAKKQQRELELQEERRRLAEKEKKYEEDRAIHMAFMKRMEEQLMMGRPNQPTPVMPTPSPTSFHNVSGVSTTNSGSATQTAASGLRLLGSGEPANISVSAAHDPDFDDLALTQFPVQNVVHYSEVMDYDDPYDLQARIGDVEASFTNLTQQYAPPQVEVPPPQPPARQEEAAARQTPAEGDGAPTVGNPST